MNTTVRFLKNTIYLAIADIASPFISMFFVIYISRTLGTKGLGAYASIIAFLFFFEKIAQLGLQHLIIRDIAVDRSKTENYLSTSLYMGLISSFLVLPFLFILLRILEYPAEITSCIKILSLSLFFFVLTQYWISFFEGLQRMEFKSFITIVQVICRAGSGILVVYLGYGVTGLIWSLLFCRILVCFMCFGIFIKLGIRPSLRPDWSLFGNLLKQTWTFFVISLVTTTYWRIDIIMLSKIKGIVDVGFYSAAYRFFEILKGLSYCYIAALFPILASSFSNSKESFHRKFVLSIKYLFILTFPISIGTSILAKNIITLVYGTEFTNSTGVLQILIWSICFFPIALVFAKSLVASKNQKFDLYGNVIAMSINVILNFVFIHRYGYIGAAMATSISICVFMFIQYFFVSKVLFKIPFLGELVRPFIAGCSMGLFTYFVRNMNIFFVIITSACIYTFVLFIINSFSGEEIKIFRELWQKKSLLIAIRD